MSARVLLLAAALLAALPQAPARAQSPLPAGGPPVEIVARDGIEWDRENMRYVARGAARITQGDKTIEAEVLTAFYRQPEGGGTEIYRYTATGSVRLTTATQRAFADNGEGALQWDAISRRHGRPRWGNATRVMRRQRRGFAPGTGASLSSPIGGFHAPGPDGDPRLPGVQG